MTLPSLRERYLVTPVPQTTYTWPPVMPVQQCQFCRFWIAEADGLFGECASELFAEKVYARLYEGSPIMTAFDLNEPTYFEAVE